jgi:hypothetical protein
MENTNTTTAANLTVTTKIVDADGMIYSVSNIERKGKSVSFTMSHDNNDMMVCKIRNANHTVRATTRIRVQ